MPPQTSRVLPHQSLAQELGGDLLLSRLPYPKRVNDREQVPQRRIALDEKSGAWKERHERQPASRPVCVRPHEWRGWLDEPREHRRGEGRGDARALGTHVRRKGMWHTVHQKPEEQLAYRTSLARNEERSQLESPNGVVTLSSAQSYGRGER